MNFYLHNLAQIQSGHPFPRRIENSENGKIAVIQMKDLPNTLQMKSASPARITVSEVKDRYLLKLDDIIFRSRGQTNTCVILKADLGPTITAAPLISIRVTSENLLPDYLGWWINQPLAQAHLDRHARGTSVQMISREALETLEVALPSLKIQQQIVELALLSEEEQSLIARLTKAKSRKLQTVLINTAMEATHANEAP
ncbi:MAG TPA: restriction endonuclease subunit S [Verrucomicrobia bacterium]|nr:MAG: hypothetical protein A2X46_14095 [Lentisphaerae bacterium GWF2_57_35]HBA84816.1 restriction endonuclease subunit S [Verrucomicrobiota bacterium]